MRKFGLIGYPLSHSFSEKYFTQKFQSEKIAGVSYQLYELEQIEDFPRLLRDNPEIRGLNVTIPYKEKIIPYLHGLADSAQEVKAVNVIKVNAQGKLTGYNSDYYGFLQSLSHELGHLKNIHSLEGFKALVLGTGGASKAVQAALKSLKIPYRLVSRSKKHVRSLLYENINEKILRDYQLIINTTPLGMHPKVDTFPMLPYQHLSAKHLCFDLVYNPEETLFLKKAAEYHSRVKGGLEMLYLQAEKAWEIWNS